MSKMPIKAIDAIQAEPERTICLVVTTADPLTDHAADLLQTVIRLELATTKWAGIPVFIVPPGVRIDAVSEPPQRTHKGTTPPPGIFITTTEDF